jgi:hypothetical protein
VEEEEVVVVVVEEEAAARAAAQAAEAVEASSTREVVATIPRLGCRKDCQTPAARYQRTVTGPDA